MALCHTSLSSRTLLLAGRGGSNGAEGGGDAGDEDARNDNQHALDGLYETSRLRKAIDGSVHDKAVQGRVVQGRAVSDGDV